MSHSRTGPRKSRVACQNCKRLRIKCDEHLPTCRSCKRLGVDCSYPTTPHTPGSVASSGGSTNSPAQPSPNFDNTSTPLRSSASSQTSPKSADELFPDTFLNDLNLTDFPESRERRLLELRLMFHAVQNMIVSPDMTDRWLALWKDLIPKMAVQYDAVLYAMCTYSATHLLQNSDVDDADVLQNARQNYFTLALREQRLLCNFMNESNAEAICLTAILILGTTFTLMWDPSQDAFESALEWLKMSKGVARMLWKISAAVPSNIPAAFKIYHSAYQRVREQWKDQNALDGPFATAFAFICERELNPENRETYRRTLVYINWIQRYSNSRDGEASVLVERRLQTFGVQAPAEFIQFVEMRHPLALVVLAYFFGVMAQVDGHYWWLQPIKGTRDTVSARELRGIKNLLDQEYHSIISWPLQQKPKLSM